MPSAFFGLNTALSALSAAQAQLDTAAHNTANASTDGYSRQRVRLVASAPFSLPAFNKSGLPGQIGTGVSVAAIERARDSFLDVQIRTQEQSSGYWDARRDELAKVETIFPEPSDSGLGTVLSKFWSAWQDVASDPTSTAARAALTEQAGSLAARLNRDSGQLATVATGIDAEMSSRVGEINDIARQLASLNEQIQRVVVSGDNANDLADQRDLLLDRLNVMLPTTVEPQSDGSVTVLVGGTDLVNHGMARPMTAALNASGHVEPQWSDGSAVDLGTGQLSALVEVRDTTLAAYRGTLDTLAQGVADAVNILHQSGTDETGAAGLPFFTYTAGNVAGSLAVNAAIIADPRLVAAASGPNAPGDGSIAGKIADLRSALIFGSGSQTASDMYAGLISRIGSDTRQGAEMSANQALVVDHLERRRESISGVSLDEEATNMIQFQHAYQAAARVITAVDEMLDQLINRTGIVGR
jgi:flagellar hook-associated protein 1 FlgK